MVLVTSLGPSTQSSIPSQQTVPCFTVLLVWLVLWAREISLWGDLTLTERKTGKGGMDNIFAHLSLQKNTKKNEKTSKKKI